MRNRNTEYPAGTLNVRGQEFSIFTTDEGAWRANFQGTRFEEPSRDELKKALMKATRQGAMHISVPFLTLHETGHGRERQTRIRRGTITGRHSGNRNMLVTWDGGEKEQLGYLGSMTVLDGDADAAEWERLREAVAKAGREIYAFQQAHKIDLHKRVQDELDRLMPKDGDDES